MSATFTLFFEPLDVLQFRDARPFDAGMHVHARSVFPLPSVFLGAIRTALFRQVGVDFGKRSFNVREEWRALLGNAEKPATFQLRGPLLAYRAQRDASVEPLFPASADLYRSDTGNRAQRRDESQPREFGVLEARQPEGWGFARWRWNGQALDRQSEAVPWTSKQPDKDSGGALWLTSAGARAYLAYAGDRPLTFEDGQALRANDIFELESRTGIARDDGTLTTLEGLFYVTAPFRLRSDGRGGYGFAVDLRLPEALGALSPEQIEEALRNLDGSVVPLGGKAHRALVRVTPGALLPPDLTGEDAPLAAGRKRKLWLVTPLPWNERGPQATLAVSGRATRVGGFDLAQSAPRPLLRALPAGSVLVADRDVCEHLPEDQRLAGYGTALVKGL